MFVRLCLCLGSSKCANTSVFFFSQLPPLMAFTHLLRRSMALALSSLSIFLYGVSFWLSLSLSRPVSLMVITYHLPYCLIRPHPLRSTTLVFGRATTCAGNNSQPRLIFCTYKNPLFWEQADLWAFADICGLEGALLCGNVVVKFSKHFEMGYLYCNVLH